MEVRQGLEKEEEYRTYNFQHVLKEERASLDILVVPQDNLMLLLLLLPCC